MRIYLVIGSAITQNQRENKMTKSTQWAIANNFSIFTSKEAIETAYAAHLRLLAKHAARRLNATVIA